MNQDELKEKENSSPASGEANQDQDGASKTPPTQDDTELKAKEAKIKELETQLVQAGHVIETLKRKDKTPSPDEQPVDEELLEQKIQEHIEKALAERLPDNRLQEAEARYSKLQAERDELLLSLRSKANRSSDSGDAGQKQPVKPNLTLTPDEERFAKTFNLSPEEIIKNRN